MMNELMNNEAILAKLDAAENVEEFCKILFENGATVDEINELLEKMATQSGEMSVEDLENVAGGGNPIAQKILARMTYRITKGKLFVKATYDEESRSITVTNRFGKKESVVTYY